MLGGLASGETSLLGLPFLCVLTWPLLGPVGGGISLVSLLTRTVILSDQDTTLMAQFNLPSFLSGLISK